ncbi:hypothetical protein OUZ56_002480 [Daphnia magna]|uniref:Uncharacterized protein n=1 Tax=Daphnia magna TaxID=35525 RepID=A0ABR0A5U8_9CRUS|nr:hypothetical protein OUZ56_002480 [Daphnia magna]
MKQHMTCYFRVREQCHKITKRRWNGGEKRCLRWAIRDPNSVDKVAEELRCVASSLRHIISAIADTERRLYEVNFHDLSENGRKMLHNFLFDIFRLQGGFTLEKCEQQCIVYIRSMVGRVKSMLMLVSGEVDFAVCAALFHEALLQVITRRECRASTSITVSCVKTNPSRSSLVNSNSGLFFGQWLLISSSYQRSDLRFQMVLVLADTTANDLNLTWDNILLEQGTLRPDLIESAFHMASSRTIKIFNLFAFFPQKTSMKMK